jgi:hypothetical protein
MDKWRAWKLINSRVTPTPIDLSNGLNAIIPAQAGIQKFLSYGIG